MKIVRFCLYIDVIAVHVVANDFPTGVNASDPVEGLSVSGCDEFGLFLGQKAITNENGIVMLYVPPYSKWMFTVSYYSKSTKETIQDSISYETAGKEDAGRQFTLQISDEMLYQLFK